MAGTVMNTVFNVLLIIQVVSAIAVFIILFFVNAPYGKHVSNKFGATMKPRAGWVLMEFPAFSVILLMYGLGLAFQKGRFPVSGWVVSAFLLIWEAHYLHRTFIFPFLISKKGKPMAILIPVLGMLFNTMNGFINGYYFFSGQTLFFKGTCFEVDLTQLYTLNYLWDPRFILGVLLFIAGMVINIQSDSILRSLRKPGETGYKIPNRGFHQWVSNPNYLGEWMEWLGFALATWSLPGLAFALYTFGNLAPRAWSNRKWYRETFGDAYPKSRKAMIPFLF